MKSFIPKETAGLTVGQIVDAMHASGEFAPLGREDIFAVVEIFLREFVGLPGSMVTKKFTPGDANLIAEVLDMKYETVVKIIAVFRLKAGHGMTLKQRVMKAYGKIKMSGGTKHGVTSRM